MTLGLFVGSAAAQNETSPPPTSASAPPPTSESAPPPTSASAPPPTSSSYAPPPSPCPEGSWWDPGPQACVSSAPPPSGTYYPPPSGTYYPPSPCPDGSWWDPGRQMCVSGAPPPPGYPMPGPSVMPYPQADCGGKFEQVRPIIEAFRRDIDARMRSFQEEFNQARTEYSQSRHSSEEWQAFMQSWQEKGRSSTQADASSVEAEVRAILGECFEMMGVAHMLQGPPGFQQPPMGGPMGGPGMPPGQPFNQLPPPPMPGGGDPRFRLSEEGQAIRAECEEKVRALMPAPMNPGMQAGMGPMPMMPMDGSMMPPPGGMYPSGGMMPPPDGMMYPSGSMMPPPPGGMMPPPGGMPMGPMGMDGELQQKIHEIMRECEKRIRETFEDSRDHGPEGPGFDESFGSLEMFFDEESGRIIVQGKFIALEGDPESQMLSDVTCDGALFIDSLFVNGLLADFRPAQTSEGTALQVFDSEHKKILSIHDNPRCVINVAASDEIPSITLDLADHLEVEESEGGGLKFSDGDIDGVLLLHGADAELGDGNQVVIEGKGTFLVKSRGATSAALGGSRYEDAIESKRLGAEVKIGKGEKDDLDVDSVPLGDIEVDVEGGDNEVSATIDSEEGTGKTVVLEIDSDVFSSDELSVLITGEDNSSLAFSEASDLEDVLDPTDDGPDGIEYWIVEDKNGFHVLVSFAHFSVKHVKISSAESGPGAFGIPGFESLLLVGGLLAAAIVVRRRTA
ncbi:MAG: hypothetical protein HYT80_03660 [Euryarchaeota archaeon]|nr:hypothetical protein [Euryarchaeota archaeon]